MSVKVRLKRIGKNKMPYFRIVIADERSPRDGAFIEQVGTYDPKKNPSAVTMDTARLEYWLSKGAKPTRIVSELFRRYRQSA